MPRSTTDLQSLSSPSRPSLTFITARLREAGCVYAEEEARLLMAAGPPHEVAARVARRVAGHPLEYVLGWAEFCGHRVEVEEGVFIPRRRTEFLAHEASRACRPGTVLLDLCCGTGAVGRVAAARVPGLVLIAADLSAAAVRCARRNLAAFEAQVHESDLYAALPARWRGRIDVLVANAPYVPTRDIGTLPREARLYEPRVSFDGGRDGHEVQRRVAAGAALWLAPGGQLLMETGEHQAAQTARIVAEAGLLPRIARSDDWDATVVLGRRPLG